MLTPQEIASIEWLNHPATRALCEAFAKHHMELRFVGGCVRDTLLGREVTDIDAATPASPDHIIMSLEKEKIRCIPTGLAHGTVTALISGQSFQITTLRTDIECDGRHATVKHTDNWEEDANRRDFTMNALYLDPEGTLYDYVSGKEDLTVGNIRFIGDPEARIKEDYLRILRFFRFLATHGKQPPDQNALHACENAAEKLNTLSGERIQQEMMKLLAAPNPKEALDYMQTHHILERVLGFKTKLKTCFALDPNADAITRLAALLMDIKKAETLAEQWQCSNKDNEALKNALIPLPTDLNERTLKAHIRKWGKDATHRQLHIAAAKLPETNYREFLELNKHWELPTFPVSGKDLIEAGISPGKHLGETLEKLEIIWEKEDYEPSKEVLLKFL